MVKHQGMMDRIKSLDMSRGFAIVTMMVLNLSAVVLAEPTPFVLRAIGSIAAPLFILLSGFMVSLTAKQHGFWHFLLQRGLWILAVGIFVDIAVWQMYPLMSVEVLYLIAVSIPLAYLSARLKSYQRAIIIFVVLLLTPSLQAIMGYTHFPTEFYFLTGKLVVTLPNQTGIVNHWLVDGWFPLFPWLVFSIIGVELGNRFKSTRPAEFNSALVYVGSMLTVAGSIAFYFAYPQTFVRGTWSELFYPPTIPYVALATGVCLLFLRLFTAISKRAAGFPPHPLSIMGQSSLGIYVIHLLIIAYFITWVSGGWWKLKLEWYLLCYVLLLIVLWGMAQGYRLFNSKVKRGGGIASRILVSLVILAMIVAWAGGFLPPLSDTIKAITVLPR